MDQLQQVFYCKYGALDNSHKTLLGFCLIMFGGIGTILNLWLLCTFLKSRLLISRNYLFLLSYCLACLGRSALAGFPFIVASAFSGRWMFGPTICHLFAFLRHLFGIFQILSLTTLAFERYKISKHFLRSAELPFRFHLMALILSWIIATVFSILPLMGLGRYSCDVTGVGCDLEWRNYGRIIFNYNLALMICCGLVPFCIWYNFDHLSKLRLWMIYTMTMAIFLLWIPSATLYLYLFITSAGFLQIPAFLPILAQLSAEASSMVPVLTYLMYGGTMRLALIDLCN